MSNFLPGMRVYDLKIFRLTGKYVEGVVCREGRRGMGVYVEWDNDPGCEDFMYDDELDRID